MAGSKILVPGPGVLTTGPQGPAARAWSLVLAAVSRMNSGKEAEGKEKSEKFIRKAEYMRKDARANSRESHEELLRLWEI